MGVPIDDLKYLIDIQMQQKKWKNSLISKTVIFCFKCFEKNTLNLSSLKPHFFSL